VEVLHDRAVAEGDLPRAARILGSGVVNLLQTVDAGHVVLAGADLLRHGALYLAAVRQAVREEVPRADWLTVDVTLSSLGADIIAAGAAMQILDTHYGIPAPLADHGTDPAAPGRRPRPADTAPRPPAGKGR
jgi:predicted NBD/HSP70 family sugar kinase